MTNDPRQRLADLITSWPFEQMADFLNVLGNHRELLLDCCTILNRGDASSERLRARITELAADMRARTA